MVTFPFLCLQTMVCCNSSLFFFVSPHFRKDFNHLPCCRIHGKVSNVMFYPHFNNGHISAVTITPSSYFGPFRQLFTPYSWFMKATFTALLLSCQFYWFVIFDYCGHILILAAILRLSLSPVVQFTCMYKYLVPRRKQFCYFSSFCLIIFT